MDADWSVELGADDHTLDFPWYASEHLRYVDLKKRPELIGSVSEVALFPELSSALTLLNASSSPLRTAKCDVWFDEPAAKIHGAVAGVSCYLDVLFDDERRFSFEVHEALVRATARSARESPDIAATIEFVVRRCYFLREPSTKPHRKNKPTGRSWRKGFYVTAYVTGFGGSPEEARRSWSAALMYATDAALRAAKHD